MKIFDLDQIYFRVTFPDPEGLYPGIESFVYIGCNLSDEDSEDTWYFQPARDHALHGSAIAEGAEISPVVCIPKSELCEMMDVEELATKLRGINARRKAA